jgi:hypothetical protein
MWCVHKLLINIPQRSGKMRACELRTPGINGGNLWHPEIHQPQKRTFAEAFPAFSFNLMPKICFCWYLLTERFFQLCNLERNILAEFSF